MMVEILKLHSEKKGIEFQKGLKDLVDWKELVAIVDKRNINGNFDTRLVYLIKCLVIVKLYNLTDDEFDERIGDDFADIINFDSLADSPDYYEVLRFEKNLIDEDVFDDMFGKLFEIFVDNGLIPEQDLFSDIGNESTFNTAIDEIESMLMVMEQKMNSIFEKNNENEQQLYNAVSFKLGHISKAISEMGSLKTDGKIDAKEVHQKVNTTKLLLKNYLHFFERIEGISGIDDEGKYYFPKNELLNELKHIYEDSEFYKLYMNEDEDDEKIIIDKSSHKELHSVIFDHFFKKLSDIEAVKPVTGDFVVEDNFDMETRVIRPIMMKPRRINIRAKDKKKYSIFNDANLTEDYELGLRFYKLGFKTSFINYKTGDDFGNSRIATGEYFPNSFKASVKQKSRWIAGIVFQNWKIHGWDGSFKTKYFLARDRKSILGFFGTALSYLLLIYLVTYVVTHSMGIDVIPMIIEKNSFLWYMMFVCLFFMFVNIFHRFVFTYNWFGLRYAIASTYRIFFDNVVNSFATARAVKVFKQTKHKVVWDCTEHY